MTVPSHPTDHAPVIPEITAANIGAPLCCVKCGGVLHLVCGDAPAATGTPAVVDRAPDPAPTPKHPCERCHKEIPPRAGRPPRVCDGCLTPAELAHRQSRRKEGARG